MAAIGGTVFDLRRAFAMYLEESVGEVVQTRKANACGDQRLQGWVAATFA